MNIRKIIREEVSDFEWTEDISDDRADYFFNQLSDAEKNSGPYRIKKVLTDRLGVSEKEAMGVLAKHHQPDEKFKHEYDEDITYWTPGNSSSSYQFKYPPKWNTLTRKFVDWVKWNPGGTKQEFYLDVLGKPHERSNQSLFFGSIQDSGIVRTEKGRNGSLKYYIGPNFEAWTQGKLKRYMGMNVPWSRR